MAFASLNQSQGWGLRSPETGHRERGPDEPTTPVAELEGRLVCLELSHPDAGSSPMPAQPAAQAQLKLSQLFFKALPMSVLPSTD